MKQAALSIRDQFPAFASAPDGKRLAYLDSAASAQKPQSVIDRMAQFSGTEYANVARGAYQLSAHASVLFEAVREKVAAFVGARSAREVVFTRGTTESLNLISSSLAETLAPGDVVLLTELEHHSNIVPWQLAAKRHGLSLHFAPLTPEANLDYDRLFDLIARHQPKVVSVTHLSNAFGTVVDVAAIAAAVHKAGGILVVDCAQSIAHLPVDVAALGADAIAFSGHKLYGPTGIGVLWAREELLQKLPPYHGGGGMISQVTVSGSSWAEIPYRFEAGTPPIVEAIGLGVALDFVSDIGFEALSRHERELFGFAWQELSAMSGVTLHGPHGTGAEQRSIISFSVEGVHPHDLATVLDQHRVQVRAGHHCAMPALSALGLPATARLSFAAYSELLDIEQLVTGIRAAQKLLS